MKIEKIIKDLTYFNEKFPKEAITEARKHKEKISEVLLDSLQYINSNVEKMYAEGDNSYYLYMYALFLLSEFREKRAFPIIINILKKDKDLLEYLIGDILVGNGNKILASTFDGNIEMLCDFIEDRKNYNYARETALNSLHILLNQKVIDRNFLIIYIQKLLENITDDDIDFVTNVAGFISVANFVEFQGLIKELYEKELIDISVFGDYDNYLKEFGYPARDQEYITDTIQEMSWWCCFNQDKKSYNNYNDEIIQQVPIVKGNKIGRNDPCPCGSGKKYKKCCIDKVNAFTVDNKCTCPECGGKMEYLGSDKGEHPFSAMGGLREKKGKFFNKEINDLYLMGERLYYDCKELAAQDYYLKVMDYLINFANENNIKTIKKLDDCGIVEEFIGNIIQDFEIIISNSDYKVEKLLDYLDRLKSTFELDGETYEGTVRTKFTVLFKLNKYDEAESMMLDYIKENPKSIWSYVDLVGKFCDIKDYEKAKYYYDIAMTISDINDEDKGYLEERMDDWYEKV